MSDPNQGGAGALPVDDTMDDARAAFEEVTKAAESAPAEIEPQAEPAKVEAEKPAAEAEEKPADARARDPETGKFTTKEKVEKPLEQSTLDKIKQQDDQKPQEQKPLEQTKPEEQVTAAPPPSWSIAAKAAWDKADPAIKEAIAKREAEVNAGFAELRDYKGLKPFRERAARSGQSLEQALHAYTGIEELFSRNPVQGFLHVADNLGQRGISPMQLGEIFSTLARQYGGTAPTNFSPADQNGQGGANGYQTPVNDPNPLLPIVQPIVQRLSSLEGMLNQRIEAERANSARSVEGVVQRFRTDPQYKYFSNVEDQIAQLIESGLVQKTGDHTADLAKAYDLACWQNPEIRAQLINEQSAQKSEADRQAAQAIADKAKAASKSLNGSAAPGTVIQEKADGADDLEADVRRAVRQHAA